MPDKLTFLFILLHVASLTFASQILTEADVDLNNFLHCIKEKSSTGNDALLSLPEDCKTSLDKLAASWGAKKKEEPQLPRKKSCNIRSWHCG